MLDYMLEHSVYPVCNWPIVYPTAYHNITKFINNNSF